MKDSRKKILQFVYDYDQTFGGPVGISNEGVEVELNAITLSRDVRYLIDNGYLIDKGSTLGCFYLSITEKGEHFVENGFQVQDSILNQSNIYNIKEANGSVIGSQQNVTLNNGLSIDDINKLIESHNTPDKEQLDELISVIQQMIEENKPVKKGFLSRFAGVLQRNEWITAPIAAFLLDKFFI